MRKLIITSFTLIFILFGIGSAATIYNLLNTTSDLRYIISLHEIDDIRHELSFSLQKVQRYAFSSPAFFAEHLDEVAAKADIIDKTVARCHECHHEPAIEAEFKELEALIQNYQEQLSFLVGTTSQDEQRQNLQMNVYELSNVILNQVQGMVSRASSAVNLKTSIAMSKVDRSYIILGITLALTFLAALIVAQYLAGRINKPVDELLTATNRIAEGELGYQTNYKGREDFETLISTFNSMSASLAEQKATIQNTMKMLNQLNLMTLPMHSANDMDIILNYLHSSFNTLIHAEYLGIILPDEDENYYRLHFFDSGFFETERAPIRISHSVISDAYKQTDGLAYRDNAMTDEKWLFTEIPEDIRVKKLLVTWMLTKNNVNGAILAINKKKEDFSEEDSRILGILANNMSVALENIRLLKDAQQHMFELKKTQRQLIEAEKLTALGTLAGGVAHDFNNILCGMIGYVALLKRNHDEEEKDFKMLDTIEKAGFRAANLTKQLLTFSRQEAMDHKPIEVNQHIDNVAKLLENTISKLITIRLDLGDSLPRVLSDPAQLEQIIMNLSVNARDAMPGGGEIRIRSEHAVIDQEFIDEHPEAKLGDHIKITISDQGEGIDREILPRIFEPFFTTKEFGKGTGLGLAMVYGIVKSHKGFIIVSSSPGTGTTFSVYLPVAGLIQDEEIQPVVSDQLLQANILIVDDEELVASMLAEHLQNLGCRTYHAGNGKEALDIIAKHKDELDVVILDLNMPVMDGSSAYEKMIELKPELKVLVASGYTLNGSVEEILAKGAHGFIQKPYSLDNIAAKIRQVLAAG